MTRDELNSFCAALPHTHHVVQWGGSDVWKVGSADKNKVFLVAGWTPDKQEARSAEGATGTLHNEGADFAVSFHTSEIGFDMLRDAPGCRPAPYLAARGMTWIQRMTDEAVSDSDLKDHIINSHRLMSLKLTKKLQKELGLNQESEV